MTDVFTSRTREKSIRETSFQTDFVVTSNTRTPSASASNETPTDFRTGVVQLQAFSNALNNVIGSLGTGFEELKRSFETTRTQVRVIQRTLDEQETDIQDKIQRALDVRNHSLLQNRRANMQRAASAAGGIYRGAVAGLVKSVPGSGPTGAGAAVGVTGFGGVGTGGTGVGAGGVGSGAGEVPAPFSDENDISMVWIAIDKLQDDIDFMKRKSGLPSMPGLTNISEDALPADIVQMLLQRLASLESRMNSHQAMSMNLKSSFTDNIGYGNPQDSYEALVGRITVLDRQLNAHQQQQLDNEVKIENLTAIMQHQERLIMHLDKKVRTKPQNADGMAAADDVSDSQSLTPRDYDHNPDDIRRIEALQLKMSTTQAETSSSLHRNSALLQEMTHDIDELRRRVINAEAALNESVAKRMDRTDQSLQALTVVSDEAKGAIDHYKLSLDNILEEISKVKKKLKDPNSDIPEVISEAKQIWRHLLGDINIGLENLHTTAVDGNAQKSDPLVPVLSAFRSNVLAILPAFEPMATTDETLDVLYPKLDKLVAEAIRLMEMDKETRQSLNVGLTLDDFVCADRSFKLCERLERTLLHTSKLLDIRVPKVYLKRRLDAVEKFLENKAESAELVDLERELRSHLDEKANRRDVEALLSKKASAAEIQHLRDLVFNQLDDFRNAGGFQSLEHRRPGDTGSEGSRDQEKEELLKRFELLYRQFQDLTEHCARYVQREEVEAALFTVLSEVKGIKTTYVDATSFREKLKKKADNTDLEKLLTLLSANLEESERTASALHAKCLACDKPVMGINKQVVYSKTSPAGLGLEDPLRAPSPLYEKSRDREADKERPAGTASKKKVMGTPLIVSADLNVIRSTIDLPAIGDGGNAAQLQQRQYKGRLRASAGGGVGPSYSHDTR